MKNIDMDRVMAAVAKYGAHFKPRKKGKNHQIPVDASRRKTFVYSEKHPISSVSAFSRSLDG